MDSSNRAEIQAWLGEAPGGEPALEGTGYSGVVNPVRGLMLDPTSPDATGMEKLLYEDARIEREVSKKDNVDGTHELDLKLLSLSGGAISSTGQVLDSRYMPRGDGGERRWVANPNC